MSGDDHIYLHMCVFVFPPLCPHTSRVVSRANSIPVEQYWHQKKLPENKKLNYEINMFVFLKKNFNETLQDFPIDYPLISQFEKSVFSMNLSLNKTMKWFGPKVIY